MTRTVFKVRIVTRDIITDFFARFKSMTGGRIKAYEKTIQAALEEAYEELRSEYPGVTNVKFGTTEMLNDAAEIIVYGEVDDGEEKETDKRRKESKIKKK